MKPAVHFVLPNDIDDPATPSGGNVYDRRVIREPGRARLDGRASIPSAVPGRVPARQSGPRSPRFSRRCPQGQTVLLDGLVACAAPEALEAQAHRLRLVVLVHMALAHEAEQLRSGDGARWRARPRS